METNFKDVIVCSRGFSTLLLTIRKVRRRPLATKRQLRLLFVTLAVIVVEKAYGKA